MTTVQVMNMAQSIEADGFAIVTDVLSKDEAASLLENLADLDPHRSRAGIRHILKHPAVNALANDPRLLGIVQEILGPHASPFRATLFDKSAESNWLITWHQDTALPLCARSEAAGWHSWSVKGGTHYAHAPAEALEQILALRVHLDDSNAQNGPLRVIAGTHKLGVLSDVAIEQMVAANKSVDCLAKQGSVLAMKPLLIHASSKSQIELPRRVLHIEYAAVRAFPKGIELALA